MTLFRAGMQFIGESKILKSVISKFFRNGDCIDKKFVCDSVIDCKRVLGEIEGRDELDCIDHENYCSHDRNLQRLPDSPLSRLIDTGYNVVRGAFSNVRMFQSERYTGGCQAIERVLDDGSKIFYRTPHNLANWTFFEERDPEAVDFRLEVYESAFAGLKELKVSKSNSYEFWREIQIFFCRGIVPCRILDFILTCTFPYMVSLAATGASRCWTTSAEIEKSMLDTLLFESWLR